MVVEEDQGEFSKQRKSLEQESEEETGRLEFFLFADLDRFGTRSGVRISEVWLSPAAGLRVKCTTFWLLERTLSGLIPHFGFTTVPSNNQEEHN